jgi:hypothetical protein
MYQAMRRLGVSRQTRVAACQARARSKPPCQALTQERPAPQPQLLTATPLQPSLINKGAVCSTIQIFRQIGVHHIAVTLANQPVHLDSPARAAAGDGSRKHLEVCFGDRFQHQFGSGPPE